MRDWLSQGVISAERRACPTVEAFLAARRSWGNAMDVNVLINNFRSVITEHYFDFNGRARRQTFWYFVLVYVVIAVVIGIIGSIIGTNLLSDLLALALLLPNLGLAVRRLHDIDRSGWWILIGIIPILGWALLIYWYVQPGTAGANQFGADPKSGAAPGGATATA